MWSVASATIASITVCTSTPCSWATWAIVLSPSSFDRRSSTLRFSALAAASSPRPCPPGGLSASAGGRSPPVWAPATAVTPRTPPPASPAVSAAAARTREVRSVERMRFPFCRGVVTGRSLGGGPEWQLNASYEFAQDLRCGPRARGQHHAGSRYGLVRGARVLAEPFRVRARPRRHLSRRVPGHRQPVSPPARRARPAPRAALRAHGPVPGRAEPVPVPLLGPA